MSMATVKRIAPIWYVYAIWKRHSFSIISKKHIKYLNSYIRVEEIDEYTFPYMETISRPIVLLHPYFYPMTAFKSQIENRLPKLKALIGLDVADGDSISPQAASLANKATAIIVPSNFAKQAYITSGVTTHVHVLNHGVDPEYLTKPKSETPSPLTLFDIKRRRGLKLLLTYIVHSPYRKGEDIALAILSEMRKERSDVALAIKDAWGVRLIHSEDTRVFDGWLTENMQIDLYDQADIFLLTSRGGGFELPGLEALARGVPVIAGIGGSWQDYMPEWGLVPTRPSGPVLEGNSIHTGRGVEMLVDKAIDKLHEMLENLDEYKAKAHEYAQTRIKQELTWPVIVSKLKDIILKYT